LDQRFEELLNKVAARSEVRNSMRLSDYPTWAQRTPKAAISSRIFWARHLVMNNDSEHFAGSFTYSIWITRSPSQSPLPTF
jgi:hypothetical protein